MIVNLSFVFPRSLDRGLIEADGGLRVMIAPDGWKENQALFPRSLDRGLIEACRLWDRSDKEEADFRGH